MINLLDLLPIDIEAKRKAACHGGEYCSQCPFCKDGDDRFLIWPKRHNKNGEYRGGRYFCRVCGKYGDAITFLILLHGISYFEACKSLNIDLKKQEFTIRRQLYKPLPVIVDPPTIWIQKATAFAEWCHLNLMKNPVAFKQIQERGFTMESIKRFKIGFNHGDSRGYDFKRNRKDWGLEERFKDNGMPQALWLPIGFTIPTFSDDGLAVKLKIRRTAWRKGDKLPKYVEVSGSRQSPSIFGDHSLKVAMVLESEFDALLIQQFAADLLYCIALGGSTKPLDRYTNELLVKTSQILFCPDYDLAGKVAWDKWKRKFSHIHRILTPDGKGPGDAYLCGIDLREWILHELTDRRISNEK